MRENVVGFVPLENRCCIDCYGLQFLTVSERCILNIGNFQGQEYDGASVMAGKVPGVSALILEV